MKWLIGAVALAVAVVVGGVTGFGSSSPAGGHGPIALTSDQTRACERLADDLTFDVTATCAWVAAEGNVGNPGQPEGNMLFISCGVAEQTGCVELDGRQWATFDSPEAGADAAYDNLVSNPGWYSGILSAGPDPLDELEAITESPWDAGHYGGDGSELIAAYDELVGVVVTCPKGKVCAS